jgi:multisubunit Na+/H+ antiporter MnhB subunit
MSAPLPLFDIVLTVLLVWLAWHLLSISDLFRATVLFITYGLLMAVAWVRLRAPDVALAEAAIGAGITGALVLVALGRFGDADGIDSREEGPPWLRALLFSAALALFGTLGWAVWSLPAEMTGLKAEVFYRLGESGVENPVTAVLLNFRAWDTLLEIAVLFLAVLGAWSLGEAEEPSMPAPGESLMALVRLLIPLIVLVSGYLLWLGETAPGGAFQGGAVLASGFVLLLLAGVRPAPALMGWSLRAALGSGFALFLIVAAGVTVWGGRLLQYPQGWEKGLILFIEGVLTVAIAVTLGVLFAGGRPPEEGEKKRREAGKR